MQIGVALWSKDTASELPASQSERFLALGNAVDAAALAFAGIKDERPGNLKTIFIAPEYLFTCDPGHRAERGRAITTDEALLTLKGIRVLSKANPNMLLIPGSIIYQHDVTAHTGAKSVLESMKVSRDAVSKKSGSTKLLARPMDSDTMGIESKIGKLESGVGAPTKVVKNRMFVFLNGKVEAIYGKKGDLDETLKVADCIFLPGQSSGVAKIDDIEFAFEICFDHELGVFRAFNGTKKVDIHIICSAFIENNTGSMACRAGGYTLHASSMERCTDIFYKGKTGNPMGYFELLGTSDDGYDKDALKNRDTARKFMKPIDKTTLEDKIKILPTSFPKLQCFTIEYTPI